VNIHLYIHLIEEAYMDWTLEQYKEVLGTKGLSKALRQNPAFIKFRKENLEEMRAEAEAKRQGEPCLPPCHFDPEWRVERAFLHTPEGLGVAERLGGILNKGQHSDSGRSNLSQSNRMLQRKAKVKYPELELVGGSEHIEKLMDEISYVAQQIQKYDFSILIEGPSGTGKELIAKGISKETRRTNFLAINCAALPGNLFESELFGYKKGAFTGASQDKPGLIKQAEGGILFLDEIGDLTPEQQGKILRLLQEKTFIPIGGKKEEKINDIRIIAATNKDLGEEIQGGKFREDLYYRLAHRVIQTIPLEERRVDIICLLHHYRKERDLKIDPRAKGLFYTYDFPGNVRELESLVYSADDYPYIKDILAQRTAGLIGLHAKILLNPATRMNMYAKTRNQIETISDREERSQKDNQNLAVFNFFDAIEKFDLDDCDWEGETQRYEILMLWGNTEYSKADICRILGIRPKSLSPDRFTENFGFDLPDRPVFSAKMYDLRIVRDIALKFYPDIFAPFFDLPQIAV
jgi:transcriptional regulator with GAF, ATPase, and Fis domain